jgi:ankyrin repeat protein
MTIQQKLSPDEQVELNDRLIDAAKRGNTEGGCVLLAAGADVHARDDFALCWAAYRGGTETIKALLAAGADVHARSDEALRWAAQEGHAETVQVLATHIFAPDSWRGKSRAEFETQANALYDKIKAENPEHERLRKVGTILVDCALRCWEQIRPPPPKFQISPLPAQPRPL